MSTEDCKYCNRVGLPLLPLRMAYVPQQGPTLPASLVNSPRLVPGMADGAYALRVITEGYVYLLDARAGGFWRCFAATASGHFKEYPVDQRPASTPSFQCARGGHAEVASLLSIERASEAGDVWIGYSRVWWTKAVRSRLKSDAALRDEFMVKLGAGAVVRGGAVPADAGVRVADGAALARLAGEYAPDQAAFNAVDRRYASVTTRPAVPRSGQAETLVQRMHAMSPGNAIVLALPDTVGITQDIRHWANLRAGDLAKYQADASKLRTRIVGDLILGLEKSMNEQGQAEQWNKRYATKVEMAKVRADKQQHDAKVKALDARIAQASKDWCKWANSGLFKHAWQVYDGADPAAGRACGAAMERDMCGCVFGSGGTREEQAWWKQWLTAPPNDPQHALWLAIAAGDKDVVAFAMGDAAKPLDVGKTDKAADVAKNARELRAKLKEWHEERAKKGLLRTAQTESGLLAYAIAAQVQVLAKANPQEALVAGQRLRILIASRMDVLVTPQVQQMTLQQLVVQMHEAVWGPPKARMSQVVQEARSLKIAQALDGAWLGTRFTSTKVVMVEVWMPEPAVPLSATAVPKGLPAPAVPAALPRPPLNHWQGFTQYLKNAKTAGQGLLGLGAALQISNLCANLIQLDRATKGNAANRDDAITESWYGVVSGTLGLTALTGEVFAGTVAARVVPSVTTAAAAKLLTAAGWTALGGGVLGVLSAGVDAVQAFRKGMSLGAEGDKDAALSSYVVVGASTLAGLGSGALAVIGAGALLAEAGVASAAASSVIGAAGFLGMGAAIPVAGWIVLVIGATVAGIYFAYKASTQEDTPLEKWLSRCCWRSEARYGGSTREKFNNLKQEMGEFQQAIYGLSVTLNWNDRWGKDEVEISVTMPGYSGDNSEYAFLLELHGPKWKRTLVHRRTSAFSDDVDLKPQPPQQMYFSAPIPGRRYIPMDEVLEFSEPFSFTLQGGAATFAGKIRVNEDYFNSAKLKFEYWPDAANQPELKMVPVPGGVNFAEAAD